MHKALKTLLRVRNAEQKVAKQRFAEAERRRIAQEDRISAIRDQILVSHEDEPDAGESGEAHDLALSQAFRLRRQVQLKRENIELHSCEAQSNSMRTELRGATQDARVVELALEKRLEDDRIEARRDEGRKLDELATTRWWRSREDG
jgi:flagellar export protein FliJ